MINMHALKKGVKPVEDSYDVGIGTQFSAETNKRDEDEEMMKYIEDQLSKRKGTKSSTNADDSMENAHKYLTPEEAALLSLPDHLRLSSTQKWVDLFSELATEKLLIVGSLSRRIYENCKQVRLAK